MSSRSSCSEIAVHIASAAPLAVDRDGIPAGRSRARASHLPSSSSHESGKPESPASRRSCTGRSTRSTRSTRSCRQAWVRDDKKTIGDLVKELSAKVGENIRREALRPLPDGRRSKRRRGAAQVLERASQALRRSTRRRAHYRFRFRRPRSPRRGDQGRRRRWGRASGSSSAAATSCAARSSRRWAWTASAPTTWECSAP